eukprot:11119376-Alexandrium_andersonii.AAC.1
MLGTAPIQSSKRQVDAGAEILGMPFPSKRGKGHIGTSRSNQTPLRKHSIVGIAHAPKAPEHFPTRPSSHSCLLPAASHQPRNVVGDHD